jgi:hypothetical protein
MTHLSKTQQLETELILSSMHVSFETVEDLPCLRVWDPEDSGREVARFFMSADAAQKLGVQALCAATCNEWVPAAAAMQVKVIESRARFVGAELVGGTVRLADGTERPVRLVEEG